MTSKTGYTPGPWELGGTMPDGSPLLLNDGGRPIVGGEGDNRKRIAVVDMQAPAKRGQAYKTHCPEREANARLIKEAPAMADVLERILDHISPTTMPEAAEARAILAKIEGV